MGFLLAGVAVPAPLRPNIVLIMADDVGYECFGCYGSEQYRTPEIDRIAERGVRFNHCYSQPLCTPSRIKIMTGLSNVRNYSAFSILNRDQRSIGQYFREAGYETSVVGKWQLLGAEHFPEQFQFKGSWPEQAGFDEACLWHVDRRGPRYWAPLLFVEGKNREFEEDVYGPDVVSDYLAEFMGRTRTRPFFIYYPMMLVHGPFDPTPNSVARDCKDKQQNFEDMVAYMDKLVGRVVKRTEELNIARETLILFTGDNGTNKGLVSRLDGVEINGGKGKTTDAGTRVPLLALWPGVTPAGQVCDDLVDFSDFLPTCLEAAGIDLPAGLDGVSFLPQLRGRRGTPRQWIYCYYCARPERSDPASFARDKRWKLYGNGEFFDIERDVLEMNPLSESDFNEEGLAAKRALQEALSLMPAEGQSLLKFGRDK